MNAITILAMLVILSGAITGFGDVSSVVAQMTGDNATMSGNMSGDNMTGRIVDCGPSQGQSC